MYKTLDDYRSYNQGFRILEALESFGVRAFGTEFHVEKGMELLMAGQEARDALRPGNMRESRKFKDSYRPYDGSDLNGKSLMVWRTGGIGDILFLRPVLCHLKKLYPQSTIMFGTRKMYHDMVSLWVDCLDGLSIMPLEMSETVDRADYHACFEGLIEKCEEANSIDVHDLFARYMYQDPDAIQWDVPMPLPLMQQDDPCAWYQCNPEQYAVVQFRASAPVRTPLLGSFVRAIDTATSAGYKVVISDHGGVAREIDNLISCCKHPKKIDNFARKTRGLIDAVRLVTHARLVVAPDSSQMHIAAMQRTPAIGLYGPFPGKVRCTRYPLARWIEPNKSNVCKFGGRKCFTHQYMPCNSYMRCWEHLNNDRLSKMVKESLCTG